MQPRSSFRRPGRSEDKCKSDRGRGGRRDCESQIVDPHCHLLPVCVWRGGMGVCSGWAGGVRVG